MRRKFSRVAVLVLACSLLLSTGCWDQKDVGNLAVLKIVTTDLITENGSDKWKVGALVMNPAGKKGGGDQAATEKPSMPEIPWIGTGLTMEEAVLDFANRSPRFPFFSHTNVIIMGERAAKERTKDIIEFFERFREARPTSFVMVTKGEAYNLTEMEPEVARTISEETNEMAERTVQPLGLSVGTPLAEFSAYLVSLDRDAVASRIKLVYPPEQRGEKRAGPAKSVIVEGLAVFSSGKLAGWFDREQTLGYMFITEKNTGEIRINMERNDKPFTYILTRSKPKIESKLVGDKLEVTLRINAEGSVYEASGLNLDADGIKEVEGIASQRIKGIVQNTVNKAQVYKSDCLGFTQNLHRWHVADWKRIKDNWRETFVTADVHIEVNAEVSDTGKLGEKF